MDAYQKFLQSKQLTVTPVGRAVALDDIHPVLFGFQRDIVKWAVRKGRCAVFADVGLGKTIMQVESARLLGGRALIIAPLAVAMQTVEEAKRLLNLDIHYTRSGADLTDSLNITNYEMIDHFDPAAFDTVVLDESSILKNMTGATKTQLVKMFANTKYRLAFTATPAPNDVTELGSHAEFLGIMRQQQMTSIFFVHDAGVFQGVQESRWRLKSHAEKDFYRWLASWSVALKKPSDIGHSDDGYELPELKIHLHTVHADYTPPGMLPGVGPNTISATDAKRIRRETIKDRATIAAELVGDEQVSQWVIWTGLNEEADTLARLLPGSVNVHGSLPMDEKIAGLQSFVSGSTRLLITKTSIAGMGMNMQRCHKMLFFGLDFSWEGFYQAIGRVYRFGQKADHVDVHVLISEQERAVYDAVERKGRDAAEMTRQLIAACQIYTDEELHGTSRAQMEYREDEAHGSRWTMLLGDSCDRMKTIADDSVHLSVYSPPFSDMYVYNNTARDLSNSTSLEEFFAHYDFIIRENLRITMPGRVACVHVQDPKTFANREGFRGLKDFTGMVVEAYQRAGWIFRSRITIDKNPQIVASRNKDTDLLFVTGKRDATDLAPMATDYLLVFKKPGENPTPVTPYANGDMTEQEWIEWAHAVWYDIRETDVLNVAVAAENDDEKHMCPLQLPLIDRCVRMWSNPGELVFSPFGGIGSEGYQAIKRGRRYLGIELKEAYWRVAQRNLITAERASGQIDMFAYAAAMEAEEVVS